MRIAEVLQNLYMHSHPSSFLQLICRLATPTPQHLIVLRSQSTAWGNKLSANPIFEQETGLRRMSLLLGLRRNRLAGPGWLGWPRLSEMSRLREPSICPWLAGWLAGLAGLDGCLAGWLGWLRLSKMSRLNVPSICPWLAGWLAGMPGLAGCLAGWAGYGYPK